MFGGLRSLWLCVAACVVGGGAFGSAVAGAADSAAPDASPGTEVVDQRDASSQTFVRPDGAYLTRVFSESVNFKDASGTWKRIDNDLVADGATGGWRNAANRFSVSLPADLSSPVRFSNGGRSVSLRLQGASGFGAVAGNRATYESVLPSTDARYTVRGDGLKEDLIIADTAGPASYRFFLDTTGLIADEADDGSIVLRDDRGQGRMKLEAPIAIDAAGRPTRKVSMMLGQDATSQWVDIAIDREWLEDPDREFPVDLDPTIVDIDDWWTYEGANADCYISSGSPNSSFCGLAADKLGFDGTNKFRLLQRFDVQNALPQLADVQSASYGFRADSKTGTGDPVVTPLRVKRSWTTGVTWNKYDGTNSWATPGGDTNFPTPARAMGCTVPCWGRWGQWYSDGPQQGMQLTEVVRGWVEGFVPGEPNNTDTANYGLLVKTDETTNTVFTTATSADPDPDRQPYIDVVWEPRQGAVPSATFDSQSLWDRAGLGVNVANGNLVISNSDLTVSGLGLDLGIGRTYNGLGHTRTNYREYGSMGGMWSLNVGEDVKLRKWDDPAGNITFMDGTGKPWRFIRTGASTYKTPDGLKATLVEGTGSVGWILTYLETGEKLSFADFDDLSPVIKREDRYGNAITYSYDASWKLSGITDTQGRTYTITHTTINGHKLITQIKSNVDNRTWTYGYNTAGSLLTSVTDPENKTVTYGYSGSPGYDLTTITDPRGKTITIGYDTSHRVTSIMRDSGTADPTTIYTYQTPDSTNCGNGSTVHSGVVYQTRVTDPNGGLSYFCIDRKGRVTHHKDQVGNKRSGTFDVRDNVSSFQGPGTGNQLGAMTYEGDGTAGQGNCENAETKFDNVCSVTSAEGEKTSMTYLHNQTGWTVDTDIRNFRPQTVKGPQGEPQALTWDPKGNLTRIDQYTGPGGTGTLVRADLVPNTDGTLQSSKDGNGNITNYRYYTSTDGGYRTGSLKDIQAPTVTAGQQLGTTSGNYTGQFDYDNQGRTNKITNGRGQITRLTYDKLDRVKTQVFGDNSCIAYTYDNNGNTTQRAAYPTNSGSPNYTCTGTATRTDSYVYDELNRRTSETQPGSVTHTYTYDKNGNMLTLVDAGGTTTYRYNADNTLKDIALPTGSCTGTISLCIQYLTYDANGNPIKVKQPSGVYLISSYDNSGKTKSLKAYNGDPPPPLGSGTGTVLRGVDYSYTSNGNQVATRTAANGAVTTYTYDGLNRLERALTTNGGSTVSDYNYSPTLGKIDANGNIIQRAVTIGGTTTTTYYAYNQNNLVCWKATTSGTACGSPPVGATTYTYDRDGNDLRGTYNDRNQTTSFSGNAFAFAGPNQWELITDGSTSIANDLLGVASTKVSTSTTYYYRDPYGMPIARKLPAGTREYYEHLDNLGSVTALNTGTGSTPPETKTYDPYGNPTVTSTTATDPFGYVSGYTSSNGLVHFGLRFYDPSIQRWTQPDQLTMPTSLRQANKFSYVGGDPINNLDPTGLYCFPWQFDCRFREGASEKVSEGVGWLERAAQGCGVGMWAYASESPGRVSGLELAAACGAGAGAATESSPYPAPRSPCEGARIPEQCA